MKAKALFIVLVASAVSVLAQTHDWKPGDMAPKFMATRIDGGQVAGSDLNPGGPVFLYFIHEGDQINTAASSYIHRIVGAYMPAKAKWYGVSDGDESHARSWLARYNNPYQLLTDRDLRLVHAFQVTSSPTVIEIGPDGRIVKEWTGLSGSGLKDLNRHVARADGVKPAKIELTDAPSTTEFGEKYGVGSGGGR